MAARHAGKRAPPPRENTVDFQPLAYRFLGNFWKVKRKRPKSAYLVQAEKDFLAERAIVPDGYIFGLVKSDLAHLNPALQSTLSLKCASSKEVAKARRDALVEKFGRGVFDASSPSVQIAIMTDKILNLRAHMIRSPKEKHSTIRMSIFLGRRTKLMKLLYKTDFSLYQWTCKELGIRCVRFSVPCQDAQFAYNPLAVDGDKAKFLIRQRMWRGKHRPRHEPAPNKRGMVLYTRLPVTRPPPGLGKAKPMPQQVSRKFPMGVKAEWVAGKQIVHNPTAPGAGHIPAKMNF